LSVWVDWLILAIFWLRFDGMDSLRGGQESRPSVVLTAIATALAKIQTGGQKS
jgi:hypothetical protein